jgi:hypothetical protein
MEMAMEKKLKNAWKNMKARCTSKCYHAYSYYGGRGITFDPSWNCFEKFCEDVGEPSDAKMELDRIDTNGNYIKQNVRWTTIQKNRANRRYKNSTGLPRGVFFVSGKYKATIGIFEKRYHLGTFDSAEEASKEYHKVFFAWNGFLPTEVRIESNG